MEELKSLVGSAQTGDLDAYGEIVRRFQDMGYGYAYSILGDFHLAEDATQEAFIEAYRCLENLRQPAAFPGWFRRIVFKHCDRLRRRKKIPAAPLEAAAEVASPDSQPSQRLEDSEMRDNVLAAIRSLPARQREVTTLFYINGYSQNDIAEFLEVPTGTVKSRLAASRPQLKERMIDMVENTLHKNAPDERFSKKVIEELLGRPHPLEIKGHPVRQIWDLIRSALPNYEVIEGEEIVQATSIVNQWDLQFAYYPDKEKVLRTETTTALFEEMKKHKAPLRMITTGRVFHHDAEYRSCERVTHQLDILCIEAGANVDSMRETLQTVIQAVLGEVNLKYEDATFHWFQPCNSVSVEINGKWTGLAGTGVMTEKTLRQAGHDPSTVGGFVIAIGQLESLAMLKYGIDDIRKLWQPPYVPE